MRVEVLGLGDAADAPAGLERVRVTTRPPLWRRPLLAAELAWRAKGSVLISLDPESAFAAWTRVRLTRRSVIVDVHEDYRAVLEDRRWSRGLAKVAGRVLAQSGILAARRADVTVVADSHLMTELPERVVVRNVPDVVENGARDDSPRAVYVGDVRASRGLFEMVDAVERSEVWSLDLVGPVAADDRDALASRVAALGDRVRIHGRLRPDESWRIAAGAWAGFSLLHDTPAFREATPSKIYEYLAHGIPVLATPLHAQACLVEDAAAGALVPDGDAAARQLDAWAADPDAHAALCRAALDWASTSSAYAEGSGRMAAAVEAALGMEPTGTARV